jgi:putative transposase
VVKMLEQHGISERRSCQLVGISRTGTRYHSRKQDADLIAKLRAIAEQHPRYGYRRAWAVLQRAGEQVNHKRVHRLWRAAKLSLPPRRPRKRRAGAVTTISPQAVRPNHVWTYDFIFDRCANGQLLKLLTVEDEYTREGLAIHVATSIKSRAVIEVVAGVIGERGAPEYIRSDNGPEFIAARVKQWLANNTVRTLYIEPGCPWQNGKGESFNGRVRDECLNVEWFGKLAEARVVIESFRRHYNEERPHSSLDYRTPSEFYALYKEKEKMLVTLGF